MNITLSLFAAFWIYSTDGVSAVGNGLRDRLPEPLINADKPTRMEAGWYDYVSTAPAPATNEVVVCTGFKRLGDDFTGIYRTYTPTGGGLKYSVRAVIRELKTANKWAAVKSLLTAADFYEEFLGSNYLSTDDADLQIALRGIVSQGILTQAELNELLSKCEWTAD